MRQFRTVSTALLLLLGATLFASGAQAANLAGLTQALAGLHDNIQGGSTVNITRNIDTSSNISVTNSVNGVAVDYGLSGANALNVIDNANGATSDANSARHAVATTLENDVLGAVGIGY